MSRHLIGEKEVIVIDWRSSDPDIVERGNNAIEGRGDNDKRLAGEHDGDLGANEEEAEALWRKGKTGKGQGL